MAKDKKGRHHTMSHPTDEALVRAGCLIAAGLSYSGTKDVSTSNMLARAQKLHDWIMEGMDEAELDE